MNIRQAKRIVLVQGAFELINNGHIKAFKEAKSHGDYLIVALNTTKLLGAYKKRRAVVSWRQKAEIIRAIRYVDKVVEATEFSPMSLLKLYDVAIYAIGDEWIESKKKEIAYIEAKGGEIVILPRYKGVICTSKIKKRLLAEAQQS